MKGEGHLGLCTPDECPPAASASAATTSYSLRHATAAPEFLDPVPSDGKTYSSRRASTSAPAPAPVPAPAPAPTPAPTPAAHKRTNWELVGFADPHKQCKTAGCIKGEGHLGNCTPDECLAAPTDGESYSLRRASSSAPPAPAPAPAPEAAPEQKKRRHSETFGFADPHKQCKTAGCVKGEGHLGLCTPDECLVAESSGEAYSLRR